MTELIPVGPRVLSLMVDDKDQSILTIATTGGDIVLETFGDCCSETWFADITGVENLIDQPILKVETLDLPTPTDDRSRQACDEAYGIRITSPRGICEIVYRNSSNGYYGGSVYRIDAVPGDRMMRVIESDWSAPGSA